MGRGGGGDGRRFAVALAAASVLLVGCQAPEKLQREATTRVTPTPNGPYTQEEWALYREAVERVEKFEARNAELLAKGAATDQAKDFYREHLRHWEQDFALLKLYERGGIRIARAAVVLSTEPATIRSFQDNAADIVLRRCIDESNREITQDGLLVPAEHDEPVFQEVTVHQYENRTWSIGRFETTDEPCAG